uniref:Serine protease like protein n=1 Tax=Rhipicephalus zambeziensis TaxID=60191 RepID=A0A224YET7_9ACAR
MAFLLADCTPHRHLPLKVFALLILATALPISANRIDKRINRRGCGRSAPVGRVYNGKPISRESIPWIVHVLATKPVGGSGNGCAGSIITSNVVLTAAHCVQDDNGVRAISVNVFFNKTEFHSGYAVKAEIMKVYPKFGKTNYRFYDIALLKLAVDLEFNKIMGPVCIPERDFDVTKQPLMVAGWGATSTARHSKIIRYAYVHAITNKACQREIGGSATPIAKRLKRPYPMICTKGTNATPCEGDSGGPMTLKDERGRSTIVGIVSYGVICDPSFISKYTRVAYYTRWIKNMLNHPGKWSKLQFNRKLEGIRLKVKPV